MTLYKRSNCTDVFFDFVCTFFIHECFILKPVCKSHYIDDFNNTQNLRDYKVSEREAHLLPYPHKKSFYIHLHFVCGFKYSKHSWGIPPHVAIFAFGETLFFLFHLVLPKYMIKSSTI